MSAPKVTEAGKEYFGFICENPDCGLPIVLGEIPREYLDASGGAEIVSPRAERLLTCQQCGYEALYRTTELQRFQVSPKGKFH
jgi:hypothetical protein